MNKQNLNGCQSFDSFLVNSQFKEYSIAMELKRIKNEIQSYLSETTVHGLRYVVEGQNVCERLFWTLMFLLGFTLAIISNYNFLKNYEMNPVQTTVETVSVSHRTSRLSSYNGVSPIKHDGTEEKQMEFCAIAIFNS